MGLHPLSMWYYFTFTNEEYWFTSGTLLPVISTNFVFPDRPHFPDGLIDMWSARYQRESLSHLPDSPANEKQMAFQLRRFRESDERLPQWAQCDVGGCLFMPPLSFFHSQLQANCSWRITTNPPEPVLWPEKLKWKCHKVFLFPMESLITSVI